MRLTCLYAWFISQSVAHWYYFSSILLVTPAGPVLWDFLLILLPFLSVSLLLSFCLSGLLLHFPYRSTQYLTRVDEAGFKVSDLNLADLYSTLPCLSACLLAFILA